MTIIKCAAKFLVYDNVASVKGVWSVTSQMHPPTPSDVLAD